MTKGRPYRLVGALSLLVAILGVLTAYRPSPWDGISPDPEPRDGGVAVLDVAPGSPAEQAGIVRGNVILGIGDQIVNSPAEADDLLLLHEIDEPIQYLVRQGKAIRKLVVVPRPMRGTRPIYLDFYLYDTLLGFLFFGLGVFVYVQRPDDEAARVHFLLCNLFLVFLVCRFRPPSYFWADLVVGKAATLALLLLPAVFLHFFLVFPERKFFALFSESPERSLRQRIHETLNERQVLFGVLYALPPILYLFHLSRPSGARLVAGAPLRSWLLLGLYFVLGLIALVHSWARAGSLDRRRQILPILLGSVFGTAPLILFGVVIPALGGGTRFAILGTLPLILVPLTFGYAIIRYQLLDIRLVIRKGLLYALTTAFVTGLYALSVAAANHLFSAVGGSSTLAFVLGVVAVLLFDPLRRKIQAPVDRLFFRDRVDFTRAIHDMSEALRGELSLTRLEELLSNDIVRLCRAKSGRLLLASQDQVLLDHDHSLPADASLSSQLRQFASPRSLEVLDRLGQDPESRELLTNARRDGVALLIPFVYQGRLKGLLMLTDKLSEEPWAKGDLEVLSTLANQAAVALETASLHDELTRQAELARDLEIAREIQMGLFPETLPAPEGYCLHGRSIPARVVGGDFYDSWPIEDGHQILVLGDVSGKSIPGALLMVASREILWAAIGDDPDPSSVLMAANRRIYEIKRRMFVALGYYLLEPETGLLTYGLAGMPTPLLCRRGADRAVPIPEPTERIPLGGMLCVDYDSTSVQLCAGDLLLMYSDGLTEVLDPQSQPFGDDRLADLLWQSRDLELVDIGETIRKRLADFAAGAEDYDDMTWLLLRYEGA